MSVDVAEAAEATERVFIARLKRVRLSVWHSYSLGVFLAAKTSECKSENNVRNKCIN